MIENYLNRIVSHDSILFFDLDGTLVDTDYANFLSYKKAILIVKNIEIEFNQKKRFTRSDLKQAIPNLTNYEIKEIIKQKDRSYLESLSYTKPIIYSINILKKYYKKNKTILVTNCRENRAVPTLKHYELLNKFTQCFYREIDSDKVNKFEIALKKLCISPYSVILFENDDNEIKDALNQKIQIQNIIKIA